MEAQFTEENEKIIKTKGYNVTGKQSSCSCSFATSPDKQELFCQKATSLLTITFGWSQNNGLLRMPSRINWLETINSTFMWRKTPACWSTKFSAIIFSHIENQKHSDLR